MIFKKNELYHIIKSLSLYKIGWYITIITDLLSLSNKIRIDQTLLHCYSDHYRGGENGHPQILWK